MRTSLNEIKYIDDHLQGKLAVEEELLLEVRKIIDHSFASNVVAQQNSHHLIREYGRKMLRQEIESIHQKLFTEKEHSGFRSLISSLFPKR
ncbi:hypothetical protein [Desertivirga arenae]|uniref:hypothetical protein n=1 Tax=Desertivirga arenae TaxID=2810309 RepID=UPI001A968402|nr:hypothetical protein [Pedobacter sp. SYSU D00823]